MKMIEITPIERDEKGLSVGYPKAPAKPPIDPKRLDNKKNAAASLEIQYAVFYKHLIPLKRKYRPGI